MENNNKQELIMKREQPFYIVIAHDRDPSEKMAEQVWRGGICSTPSQAWADATSKYGLAIGTMLNDYFTLAREAEGEEGNHHFLYPKKLKFMLANEALVLTMYEVHSVAES